MGLADYPRPRRVTQSLAADWQLRSRSARAGPAWEDRTMAPVTVRLMHKWLLLRPASRLAVPRV